jgi:Putative transposase/Transposase zinc-binding domain
MSRPVYEVADVLRQFLPQCDSTLLTSHQKRTLQALQDCRTAALGGHMEACDSCGTVKNCYNSCRNRHCPKCQSVEREAWMLRREEELLPVGYFHTVFTLPYELNGLCLKYPTILYDLLFSSAWQTLETFANDEKWLGAKGAATMILHTWGQNMSLHPHIHCIVPGGGLDKTGRWVSPKRSKGKFLYPVLAMSKVFKALFLKGLDTYQLLFIAHGFDPLVFKNLKAQVVKKSWVVYCKPPFSKVENVVEYLGRYTHKIALSNHRILDIDGQNVKFSYKDYADKGAKKEMILSGEEFIRRFALHILPPKYRRIRHYGFLSNAVKAKSLALARRSLKVTAPPRMTAQEVKQAALTRLFKDKACDKTCGHCQAGVMVVIAHLPPIRAPNMGKKTTAIAKP